MMDNKDHVVVIGGGIIGGMCAWYLSRSGHRVTIVDRQEFGAGCSHGNCGYVCPSHILPLAVPGALREAAGSLFKRNSPLSIRWRWSPTTWKWLYRFAAECKRSKMLRSAVGRHELLQLSMKLYREIVDSGRIECEWQTRGLLFVFQSPARFDHFAKTNDLLATEFGVAAEPIENGQLTELEPALRDGLGGGWYYRDDCHLRPDKLIRGLKRQLQSRNVSFIEHVNVDSSIPETGRLRGIKIGRDSLEADQFVVATGALTPFLNQFIGCNIPIEPGKGYSITVPKPVHSPRIPMIFEQQRVAVTPLNESFRIGSTMEFAGYDQSISPKRLRLLRSSAEHYLRETRFSSEEQQWFGWRPMTWDGKPIIDRSPKWKNVWLAAGHNMLGISMAPGTGRLIQQLIDEETPSIEMDHFSLARF